MLSSAVRTAKDADVAELSTRLAWYHDFDRLTDFSDFKGVCDSIKDECTLFDWDDSAVSSLNQALRAGDPWRAKEVLTAIQTAQMEVKDGRTPGEIEAEDSVHLGSVPPADFVTDSVSVQSEGLPSSSALGRRPAPPVSESSPASKYAWGGHAISMCNQLYCAVQVLRARLAVLHTIEKQLMQIETSFLLALKRLKEEKMTVKQQTQEVNKLRNENAKLRTENMELGRDLAVKTREIDELYSELRRPGSKSSTTGTLLSSGGIGSSSSITGLKSPPIKSTPKRGTSSASGTPSSLSHHHNPEHLLSPKMAKSGGSSGSGSGKKGGSKKKRKKHGKQGSVADLFIANIAETLQTELESRLNSADSDDATGSGTAQLVIEIADTTTPSDLGTSTSPAKKKGSKKKDSSLNPDSPSDKPRTSMSDIVFAKSFAAKWAKRGKKKAKAKKKAEAAKTKGSGSSGGAKSPGSGGKSSSSKKKTKKKKKKKSVDSTAESIEAGAEIAVSKKGSNPSGSRGSGKSTTKGEIDSEAGSITDDGGVSVIKKSELNDALFAKVETVVHSSQELEEAAGESYKKREVTAAKLETVRKIAADLAQATGD